MALQVKAQPHPKHNYTLSLHYHNSICIPNATTTTPETPTQPTTTPSYDIPNPSTILPQPHPTPTPPEDQTIETLSLTPSLSPIYYNPIYASLTLPQPHQKHQHNQPQHHHNTIPPTYPNPSTILPQPHPKTRPPQPYTPTPFQPFLTHPSFPFHPVCLDLNVWGTNHKRSTTHMSCTSHFTKTRSQS
ncbi:extensin-like [Strongylocentrotus purpuratus]|uniref:Uncharacterized protein n=1 Tax=Strongylocentrotus purpuratus TaxID=7668 RepID=A0A7M7N2D8_STRPU|nr:extensin-like [Strongylocentrotus purpuratus]